jgi:alkaline phosphatase D
MEIKMYRGFLNVLCVFVLLLNVNALFAAPPEQASQAVSKIIYGSCIHQNDEQPIWQAINREQPDVFVFLGDNIYGDTDDMGVLQKKYQKLGSNAGFQTLKKQTPIVATWDDHDYGANDAGKDYPYKEQSRKIMLDFFEEPVVSQRRTRESGIYTAYYFGEGDKRVQLILTDLRWNKTTPEELTWYEYLWSLVNSKGPYLATSGEGATLLGEAQWQWLAQELKKPAVIRIVASSLQVIPESSGWEAWAVFPEERKRLFDLLKKAQQKSLFLISGDTHWAEFSRLKEGDFELLELTSSGLTEEWDLVSPNEHRVGDYYNKANFGMIEIDWEKQSIKISINNVQGEQKEAQTLVF